MSPLPVMTTVSQTEYPASASPALIDTQRKIQQVFYCLRCGRSFPSPKNLTQHFWCFSDRELERMIQCENYNATQEAKRRRRQALLEEARSIPFMPPGIFSSPIPILGEDMAPVPPQPLVNPSAGIAQTGTGMLPIPRQPLPDRGEEQRNPFPTLQGRPIPELIRREQDSKMEGEPAGSLQRTPDLPPIRQPKVDGGAQARLRTFFSRFLF